MSTEFESVSPIDGDVVWSGRATPPEGVQQRMKHSRAVWESWKRTSLDARIAIVRRYGEELASARQEVANLITREVGKLSWDSAGEVAASIAKVEVSIKALNERRSTYVLEDANSSTALVSRRVRYQPLGVTLVLGPFNFPLHLPGGQIIPALLAGNTVVFKPSEQATAVGNWMVDAWERAGLPQDVLQMIPGEAATAKAAIDAPELSAVFLTGGQRAGEAIHRQLAGRPGVLLALELGGNNPVVVTNDTDPMVAARLISFSAFISSGQRCTCARRALFVVGDKTEQQIEALVKRTHALRLAMPGADPVGQIGPLISSYAVEMLRRTYDKLVELGCRPVIPFQSDQEYPSLVHPSILDATGLDPHAMTEMGCHEWFGPMLVIARVSDFESALESAAETRYGLSAALLGGDKDAFEQFVDRVGAGVVNWNGPTTGAAGNLPFGGLGDSGNHRPAGYYAIDFCNDPVASIEHQVPAETDPWEVAK